MSMSVTWTVTRAYIWSCDWSPVVMPASTSLLICSTPLIFPWSVCLSVSLSLSVSVCVSVLSRCVSVWTVRVRFVFHEVVISITLVKQSLSRSTIFPLAPVVVPWCDLTMYCRSMLICHHVLAATNWFCWHCTVVLQQQCDNAIIILLLLLLLLHERGELADVNLIAKTFQINNCHSLSLQHNQKSCLSVFACLSVC